MTEKLNDFVALLAEAKKKQQIEEQEILEKEKEDRHRKVAEASPFLEDLFSTVSQSKKVVQLKKEEEKKKAEPILKEFQEALKNPEKFKESSESNKKKVIEIVEQLESKADELERKLKNSQLQKQISSVEKEELTELEKKFLTLFKTLQSDFNTLKQYVNAIPRTNPAAWGATSGSGEVNLRHLDDVDSTTIANNRYLRYSEQKKKFEFAPVSGGGGSQIETKSFLLSGVETNITVSQHQYVEYVSYYVRNRENEDVSVIVKENNLNFNITANSDMSGLTFIIKGY